jgi:hypothetical protein
MDSRHIKLKCDKLLFGNSNLELGGFYAPHGRTYLRIGFKDGKCLGVISNAKLVRFAKTVLKYHRKK